MNGRRRGTIEMATAMAISGTIGWFVVQSARTPFDLVFWRCAIGAASLAVACLAVGPAVRLSGRQFLLCGLGGTALVVNWLLLFAAFPRASIAIATTVYSTQPLMLVALGAVFFGERPSRATIAWLLIAFAGIALVTLKRPSADYVGPDHAIGVTLALGAALAYAGAAALAKALPGVPPPEITFVQLCVGSLLLAPFADASVLATGRSTWLVLATLGVVHTGLVFVLQYGAFQRLPTHIAGSIYFVYPLVAIIVDRVAFGHRLSAVQLVGVAAVLVGAGGMNRRRASRAAPRTS